MFQRRSVIMGLGALVAAPAVVRAASIMRVRGFDRLIVLEDQGANDVVSFTIYGWDNTKPQSELYVRNPPVAIHLSQSWRASW